MPSHTCTQSYTHAVTYMPNKSFLKNKSLKTCCAHSQLQNASHLENVSPFMPRTGHGGPGPESQPCEAEAVGLMSVQT